MADQKKKALQAVAEQAAVAAVPEAAPAPAAPAAKPDSSEMGWGDALMHSLVALAPTAIGAAVGGGEGAQAGARAGQAAIGNIQNMAAQKAAKAEKAMELARQEKETGIKEKSVSLAERKQKSEESESKQRLALEARKLDLQHQEHLAKAEQGKALTGEQTASLADLDSSDMQLQSLTQAIDKNAASMGPIAGRVAGLNPYGTQAKAFDSQMKIAAQNIGKSLEGGKLTDADISRYREMLPSLTDTPELAKAKIQGVQELIAQRRQAALGTMGGAGYNVKRLAQPSAPAPRGDGLPGVKSAQAADTPALTEAHLEKMSVEELKKFLGQ